MVDWKASSLDCVSRKLLRRGKWISGWKLTQKYPCPKSPCLQSRNPRKRWGLEWMIRIDLNSSNKGFVSLSKNPNSVIWRKNWSHLKIKLCIAVPNLEVGVCPWFDKGHEALEVLLDGLLDVYGVARCSLEREHWLCNLATTSEIPTSPYNCLTWRLALGLWLMSVAIATSTRTRAVGEIFIDLLCICRPE